MIKKGIENMNKEELDDVISALNSYVSLYGNDKSSVDDKNIEKTKADTKKDDSNFGIISGGGAIIGALSMIFNSLDGNCLNFKAFLIGSSITLFSVLLDYIVSIYKDKNKVYKDLDELKNKVKIKSPKNLE